MANTKSAKKRIRRNERHRQINRVHRGRARTFDRKAREALATGNAETSTEAIREAVKWLDHAASKGVIHKNKASRRKARLMKQLAKLEAQG